MGDCWGWVLYIEVYKSRYHNNWTWRSSPRSGASVILSVRALRISDRRKDGPTTVTKKTLQTQTVPQSVDALLRSCIHQNFVRPRSRESLGGPLPRRVDAHFRSEVLNA